MGLAFSTAGDVVLDLGEQFFVFGLLAFLFAHISYNTLFVRSRRRKVTIGARRVVAVSLVVAYLQRVTLSVDRVWAEKSNFGTPVGFQMRIAVDH